MSWSSRRRLMYATVVLVVVIFVLGGFFFFFNNEPPSCFDGKQNGAEIGVDCGGKCNQVCSAEVAPLSILWSRVFPVSPQNYSAVAYVENPNNSAGIESIKYKFEFFDDKNALVYEREGSTYITPGSLVPIFESGIKTGNSVPVRTFFEFTEEPEWSRASDTRDSISIREPELSSVEAKPRLDALIQNSSPVKEFNNIDIIAVIFDTDGNAIAASRTLVPTLGPRDIKDIVFTWPLAFEKNIERCVLPSDAVLLLDTSGSMNDDGDNPPQPISDAKSSALLFVDRLSQEDRIGIISFASSADLNHSLSSEHVSIKKAISDLAILPAEEGGQTNIADAITLALAEFPFSLKTKDGEEEPRKVIILLTDGKANAPEDPGGEIAAGKKAQEAKSQNIIFYTIGLGDKVNTEFLSEIASSPENYFQAVTSSELDDIYRSISESICERGAAVIDIIAQTRDVFE